MFSLRRQFLPLLLAACLPAACGCKKEGIKLVPVTGQVIYKGKGLPGASVNFLSQDKQYLALGVADEDGKVLMRTHSREGARPGRHRVWIAKFLRRQIPSHDGSTSTEDSDENVDFGPDALLRLNEEGVKRASLVRGPPSIANMKARAKAMEIPLPPSVIPLKYFDPNTSMIEIEVFEDQENHFTFTILDPEEDPQELEKKNQSDEKSKTLRLETKPG